MDKIEKSKEYLKKLDEEKKEIQKEIKNLKRKDKMLIKVFFVKPSKKLLQKIENSKIKKEEKKLEQYHKKINESLVRWNEMIEILNDKGEEMTEQEILSMPLNESVNILYDLIEDFSKKV